MASFKSDRVRKPYARPGPRVSAEGQWVHDRAPGAPRADLNGKAKAPSTTANNKIAVSNLHYEITPKDLTAIFGQIGTLVREPLIRYDRSGRSSGTAIITFETPAEATRAKNQFNGIAAKGQPMAIAYDTMVPRTRRSASAPLINRIQKPALLDRISRDDAQLKSTTTSRGFGPIRSRPPRSAPKPQAKKPKTAEDLDKELDAFMGDSTPAAATSTEKSAQDVDMA
ncbi:hypothetical protein BDN72DRAFT_842684 [Pluteus cervinus]|uniref:Uncharacterized protein n=1 Tax=Pluteus cervinus TaxID=181527 RepID=A0ACD3AQE8_9AGAR|nr:hypothetical protein BDN72DRAFT_842684 [Pluteus cervinus]